MSAGRDRKRMRSISLRRWLPLYAVAMPVLVFSLWAVLHYSSLHDRQVDELRREWQRNFLAADTFVGQLQRQPDPTAVRTILEQFAKDSSLKELVVFEADNTVFSRVEQTLNQSSDGGASALTKMPAFDSAIAQQVRSGDGVKFIVQDGWLVAYYALQVSSESYPLPPDYLVFLNYNLVETHTEILTRVLRDALWPFLLVLIGSLAGVGFINRFISRPLQVLLNSAENFARGERIEAPLEARGELGRIAQIFNKGSLQALSLVDELRDREQYVDRLFEATVEGLVVIDANAYITRLNSAAERITGYRREEIEGCSLEEIFQPVSASDPGVAENAALSALRTGRMVELVSEQIIVKKNGEKCHITQTAAPIFDPEGISEGVILVFRDVTEAYYARIEHRIGAVAFESDQPIIVANAEGRVLRVNSAARDIGLYGEDITDKYIGDLYKDIEDGELKDFLYHPGNRGSWVGRTVRVDSEGNPRHIMETITAVRDELGVVTHFVVTQRDISELVETGRALSESESRYRLLIRAMSDGVALFDENGYCVECNWALAEILGRDERDFIGKKLTDFSGQYQPNGVLSSERWLRLFEKDSFDIEHEWQATHVSGRQVGLALTVVAVEVSGGREFLVTFRDITQRREQEERTRRLVEELGKKEKMGRLATEAAHVAIFEIDFTSGNIEWLSATESTFGLPREALSNIDTIDRLLSAEARSRFGEAIKQSRDTGQAMDYEESFVTPEGLELWFRATGEVECDAGGKPAVLRGAVNNITAIKLAHLKSEQLAYYDPLTGLANRRLLLDRLQQACAHAERKRIAGALLFVDLDHFKIINDSLGHKTGDYLLQQIANRLTAMLREEDTVARLGGDEFVVILPELSLDGAQAAHEAQNVAEKIIAVLGEGYELAGQWHQLRASIGIALFPRDGSGDTVLDHADTAMYKAKNMGRNSIAFYEPLLQQQADARLALERDLNRALDLRQMQLYFQPQVDSQGSIIGAEALLRWLHPERGLVLPDAFIPIAEDNGLMVEFGEWVLREACSQLARWTKRGVDLRITINISLRQFGAEGFLDTVASSLADHSIPKGRLMMEVTEALLVEHTDKTAEVFQQLKALGVGIAIDNFGAGYSSLHDLQRLPIDRLKVDSRYIKDVVNVDGDQTLMQAMFNLARDFNLEVLAERVETQEQFEFLRARECACYQGYLFGKPMEVEEFDDLLSADPRDFR
ncbi:MAG: EAL domain-containing protein [Porticoccaceae bacterium]|nr:EAL domain-containing protein [Porticoccaceae bacterium]